MEAPAAGTTATSSLCRWPAPWLSPWLRLGGRDGPRARGPRGRSPSPPTSTAPRSSRTSATAPPSTASSQTRWNTARRTTSSSTAAKRPEVALETRPRTLDVWTQRAAGRPDGGEFRPPHRRHLCPTPGGSDFTVFLRPHAMAVFYVLTRRCETRRSYATSLGSTPRWRRQIACTDYSPACIEEASMSEGVRLV